MSTFLLDENISSNTTSFLRDKGYQVKTVEDLDLSGAEDSKIAKTAANKNYIIITLDLDFGEIFYFGSSKPIGVIVVRSSNQTSENINSILINFLESKEIKDINLSKSLVVVDENKVRIRTR